MTAKIDLNAFDAPILEERPWAVFSACKGKNASLFFASTRADERAALAICDTCSVANQCLEFALGTRERFGVWGGTNERDRRKLFRG